MASPGVERALQPFDAFLDQHDVETARRQCPQPHQVMARSKDDSSLLGACDAAARAAVGAGGALTHFDEDQRVVARIAQHQVDLATAAARGSIIARHQPQASRLQMRQRRVFGRIAALLGRLSDRRLVVPKEIH